MYEYEIEITVEDNNKEQRIIKRYYVCEIMGRYRLKDYIEKKLKEDEEISKYKMIKYTVLNWENKE